MANNSTKFNVPVPREVWENLRAATGHNRGGVGAVSNSKLVVDLIHRQFHNGHGRRPLDKLVPEGEDRASWKRLSIFIPNDLLLVAQKEVNRQAKLTEKPFTGSLTSAIAWLVAKKYGE